MYEAEPVQANRTASIKLNRLNRTVQPQTIRTATTKPNSPNQTEPSQSNRTASIESNRLNQTEPSPSNRTVSIEPNRLNQTEPPQSTQTNYRTRHASSRTALSMPRLDQTEQHERYHVGLVVCFIYGNPSAIFTNAWDNF